MELMDIVYLVVFFVFGAIFGSFSNVLIERLPNNMSIIKPASHCMKCGEPIKWYDNIPILSYLILRGRCRHCHEKYSSRYFFIELVNAVMYALIYFRYRLSASAIIFCLLFTIFGAIFFIDVKHFIIPDSLNFAILTLAIFSMIFNKFYIDVSWLDRGLSVIFSLLLIVFILLLNKIKKKEYLGFGDIKLIGFIGILLGFKLQAFGLFIAAIIALFVEVVFKRNKEKLIPFGPYLCIGYLISIAVGELFFNWYFSLFS